MNVNDIPFKEFFETSLKTIAENKPSSVAIVAVLEDGNVFTGYCNASVFDQALMANAIHQDQTIEIVKNNIDRIMKEYEEGEEEEYGRIDEE